ncbi:hypothetical protein BA950_08990 [Erythrobacter sp. SAORIC-644]|uniref:hypothetical protein n=1 Tax=Erythrobacter sp. SAORIC-644 TaxID=1869314 RepID=UPI000C9F74DF|nr:hypothetical protein [Erythrobacter sp. SAORIC-644]PNQ76572.1 hypothetical protein BA950_08990 [Erythrobacter sp. SAORIC-644]
MLRIALLSVLDGQSDPRKVPAPFRRLAGARLVERQLDIALAAGCESIACLVNVVGREVMDLQHRAEAAGARFIAIREPRKLSGLVTASDELLVIAPGILPDDEVILRHLAKPCILAFPEDPAINRGYERIDAHFAWAGALLTKGNAVETLAQLPGDIDAPSALLRIALQSGMRTVPLETRLLEEHIWLRDPSPEELAFREKSWVSGHADVAAFTAPGLAIAERMGVRLAQDTIGGRLPRILALSAALSGLLALSSAIGGWLLPAFGLAILAALLFAMEEVVRRVSNAGQVKPRVPPLIQAITILFDPLLFILIALASPEDTGWLRLFVPAILFGLLHLGDRISVPRWRRSYADRVLLTVMLLPAVILGVTQPVVAVLSLAILVTLFLTSGPRD